MFCILVRCYSLDDGRKALGLFMYYKLKHYRSITENSTCPHCNKPIPRKHVDEYVMSAHVEDMATALEIVEKAIHQRLDLGVTYINNKE